MTTTATASYGNSVEAIVNQARASALMKDFIHGTLARVDALTDAGLPPLDSTDAFYERISDDQEGNAIGVSRQREDNEGLAKAAGVIVPEANRFRDNDIGASTRSKKPRPDFERLLAYITTGQIKRVFSYSNSRLTRRPMELELLIQTHERHGVEFVTKVSGTGDLSRADGKMMARMLAAVDTGEAERIAERIARANLGRAQEGTNLPARRPFGWGRSDIAWKAQTPEEKASLNPVESRLLLEAIDDLTMGRASIRAIADRWQAAGVPTITGSPWHPTVVRQMLRSPRLPGWSVYRGEVVTDNEERVVRGQWEPLVDDDTYDRLQAVLDRRGKEMGPGPRPAARRYLLSGLVRCGVCRARMTGVWIEERQVHRYLCAGHGSTENKHVVTLTGPGVDEMVTRAVLVRYDKVDPENTSTPEFAKDAELAEVREMLAELEAQWLAKKVDNPRYFRLSAKLEEERDTLVAERDAFIHATVGPPVVPVTPEMWGEMSLGERRARIERLVDAVIVRPAPQKSPGPTFDETRVDIMWRSSH